MAKATKAKAKAKAKAAKAKVAKAEKTAKAAKKNDAPVELTGQAARHLRGLGHALAPVVSIGKNGITDALVAQTARALLTHELVKVRVQGEAPVDRKEAGALLAAATRSALAQILGRTFLLYKPHPEKPRIVLPKGKKALAKSGSAGAARAETSRVADDDGDVDDADLDGDVDDGDDGDDDDAGDDDARETHDDVED